MVSYLCLIEWRPSGHKDLCIEDGKADELKPRFLPPFFEFFFPLDVKREASLLPLRLRKWELGMKKTEKKDLASFQKLQPLDCSRPRFLTALCHLIGMAFTLEKSINLSELYILHT